MKNLIKVISATKRHFISNGKCYIKKIAQSKYVLGSCKGYKIASYKQAQNFFKLNF